MKLNDPFGRLEKKNQANYEMMRDAMKKGGIDTVPAAQDIITKSKNRSLKFMAVVMALLLIGFALKPHLWAGFLCMAMLIAAWTGKSILNGRRYVERYIKEELSS
jgi:hypothetical protein